MDPSTSPIDSPSHAPSDGPLVLHLRRLKGRTDTDTFFSSVKSIRGYLSSVKSIRGYTCVQIFCHVMSDFLFVRCMQRESHSHGAYQDYIREVGALELIVTDNSRTQTGKKWEKTSRDVMTKQRRFTPHNQNESKVECRIIDVKHKVVLVLQRAKAPLIFWCHALIFVVDCLNHLAKKPLGWKTSTEVLNGDMVNISPFRFSFGQPIKFLDNAQFLNSYWIMGRFLGIAWDTFTFKVWSETDGKWQASTEFTRNVVRTRADDEMPTNNEVDPELDRFKFQRMTHTNKRKRSKEFVYELTDIPEYEEAEDTMKAGNGDEELDNAGEPSNVNPVDDSLRVDATDPGEHEDGTQEEATNPTPKPT